VAVSVEVPVPKSEKDVSAGWVTAALGDALSSPVSAVAARRIGEGAGVTSLVLRLGLSYEGDAAGPASVIFKSPGTSLQADPDRPARQYGFYEREARFFQELAPEVAIAPRCYSCEFDRGSGEPGLLLEDLAGYDQEDDRRGLPAESLRRCVGVLAAMHSEWWQSPRLSSCDFLFTVNAPNAGFLAEGHSRSWASFLERYGHVLPPGYEAFRPPLSSSLQEAATGLGAAPRTLVHLDFRADNLFFGGDPPRTVAIDWQLATRGPGVADLATLFCHSIATDLRRELEEDLMHLWHEAVVSATATSYSFEQAGADFRRWLLFHVVRVVIAGASVPPESQAGELIATYAERAFACAIDHEAEALVVR
jgi:aminoglycoside phosphotransferase (APT) family kinase protein